MFLRIILCLLISLGASNINLSAKTKSSKEFKALYRKAKNAKSEKNYYEAVNYGAQAAVLEPTNKTIVNFVSKYYKKSLKSESKIESTAKSTGGEFVNDKLVDIYSDLVDMYASLAKMPTLYNKKQVELKFEIKEYSKEFEASKKNAAEDHYNKGKDLFKSNDIKIVKKACDQFDKCGEFIKDYNDYKQYIAKEAMNKANSLINSGKRLDKYRASLILNETRGYCPEAENNKRYKLFKKLGQETEIHIYMPDLGAVRDWDVENQIFIDGKNSLYKREFDSSKADLLKDGYKAAAYIDAKFSNYKVQAEKKVNTETREALVQYETSDKKKITNVSVKGPSTFERVAYGLIISEKKKMKTNDYSILTSEINTYELSSSCDYVISINLRNTKTGETISSISKSGNISDVQKRKEVVGNEQIIWKSDKKLLQKKKIVPVSKGKLESTANYNETSKLMKEFKEKLIKIYE
ncbi:hypothetical protein ACXR6G_00195 [Ancylomarina sp. YFZ004]